MVGLDLRGLATVSSVKNEDTKVQNADKLHYYTDVIRTHARIIIALRKVDAFMQSQYLRCLRPFTPVGSR